MMSLPTLSVIMPVYNAEKYLNSAVDALLNQTLNDIEIICVNDCSKDNSLNILYALANKDSRIKVIDSKENVGAGEARNLGLEKACGKYITFMDADDFIEPDLYEKAVELAEANNADEVVWGLTEEHYDKHDVHKKSVTILPPKSVLKTTEECMSAFIELEQQTLFGYQWNSLYKADIIKDNNIRFEKALFYEDFFFNLAVARYVNTLATLDFSGYHYFKRINGSITNSFSKDYYDLSYRRVKDILDFFEERNSVTQRVNEILCNKLLRYTLSAICRNFNKLSEMDNSARKEWFLNCCEKELYKKLLPCCKPSHPAYAVLKICITNKNAVAAQLLGRAVSVLM